MKSELQSVYDQVVERDPNQPEFHQAVKEVLESLGPVLDQHPEYTQLVAQIVEPERVVQFRVLWEDDAGALHVNRGFRVQMNSAIGPYKGGLRFHPTVNLSILKFLGFEQVFKNALTTLPLGGGKGGSDFNPRGRSDSEIRRFCQNFMLELARHIGPDTDVPAGDIGVSAREIGYMFGMYKKIKNSFQGVLTGKGIEFGGSLMRTEATGYGLVYFLKEMLSAHGDTLQGKDVAISGSGNVAQYAAEKVIDLGGNVVTLSDSSGWIHDPAGITTEKLAFIKDLKNVKRGRIEEYVKQYPAAEFVSTETNRSVWSVKCQVALPCATQNELNESDAKALIENGVIAVAEGANMPSTPEAVAAFASNKVLFAPGKASNAGGVATSGLEMAQNSSRTPWTAEEVDEKLKQIMSSIHASCAETAKRFDRPDDYVFGANVAGFLKVAAAMKAQGI